MERWTRPYVVEEELQVNENVAQACYEIACLAGDTHVSQPNVSNWESKEYGENTTHSAPGTAGTCADPLSNRVITNGMHAGTSIQENNSKQGGQGWINGYIDKIENNNPSPGSIVYWHTVNKNNTRRWNHWGVIQETDPNHPNHS